MTVLNLATSSKTVISNQIENISDAIVPSFAYKAGISPNAVMVVTVVVALAMAFAIGLGFRGVL